MSFLSFARKSILTPNKIPLAMQIELKSLAVILRYGMPDIILEFLGGLGDELLLSVVAQELKKRNPKLKIWQISPVAELLFNNPCYSRVFSSDYWYLRYTNLLNSRRCKIDGYVNTIIPGEQYVPPTEHIAAVMCRKAGIKGEIALNPRVFLTPQESKGGSFAKGSIVVNCPGKDSYAHMKINKLWNIAKYQQVIDIISSGKVDHKRYQLIQLGSPDDPPLEGVVDLRGKTSLRESAAILQNCDFFLGFEGFLMHLARSVDCRSVIIYGGFAHSWQTGYTCNENINSSIDCSPCWKLNTCQRERVCMTTIKAEDVFQAIKRLLIKIDAPLETDSVWIE